MHLLLVAYTLHICAWAGHSYSFESEDEIMDITIDKSIYSDPTMRSGLKKYYESKYQPFRDELARRKESGETQTIRLADGRQGQSLSVEQLEKAIPSFDKWLEMQENSYGVFNSDFEQNRLGKFKEIMELAEEQAPDSSSKVRGVFSHNNQILGYVSEDGGIVTHGGATALLAGLQEEAAKLNLSKEETIAYILKKGQAKLSSQYHGVQVDKYSSNESPSNREFAAKWYPNHDVDAAYASSIAEMKATMATFEKFAIQQQQNTTELKNFLLQSLQEA